MQRDLLGRDDDRRTLGELLGAPGLLTLVGPGGMGKTALASALARENAWPIVRITATTRDGLLRQVAHALQVPLPTTLDELSARIGARVSGSVLVLDNLEQVAAQAIDVGRWAAEASILATSRIPLGLPGERVHPLGPLPSDAARMLFRRRSPGADGAALQRLVERLDGLPLAIELAADRSRLLGVDGVLARLERSTEVLGSRQRDPRHASLRQVLDDTLVVLPADTARGLAHLTVFRDAFTAAAAEAVLGPSALGVLEELELAGLVRVESAGRSPRLRMLQVVRDSYVEHAIPPEVIEAHRRWLIDALHKDARPSNLVEDVLWSVRQGLPHSSEAVALLVQARPLLEAQVTTETANELLATALAHARGDDAAAIADALGRGRRRSGDMVGATEALEQGLALATSDVRRAELLHGLASVESVRGESQAARRLLERALRLADGSGEDVELAVKIGLGTVDLAAGDLQSAERRLREVLDAVSLAGGGLAAMANNALANVCVHTARFTEALHHYGAALRHSREAGRRSSEGVLLHNMGLAALGAGDLARAADLLEQTVGRHRAFGRRGSQGIAMGNLARVQLLQGARDQARQTAQEAIALLVEAGRPEKERFARMVLAWIEAASGLVEASAYQAERAAALGSVPASMSTVREVFLARALGEPAHDALARLERTSDAIVHAERQHLLRGHSSPATGFWLGSRHVDLDRATVTGDDWQTTLTPMEVELLGYLARRAGQVASHDEVRSEVWGHHPRTSSRAVHHAVTRLRRKLEVDPSAPSHLKTVRGRGYVLDGVRREP